MVLEIYHKLLEITNKNNVQQGKRKKHKTIAVLFLIIILATPILSAKASLPNTIKRIDLTIDLGEGVKTDGQITYPAIGNGPFPIVLLIPGGGLTDMDEYIPASATSTGKPATPMKQIAEHLSERGFMVLRYNKRGVTRNATMANYEVYSKATVNTFKSDAEAALLVLKNNPRAEISDITVIGHSESSIIATRMAKDDPSITKVVMMGGAARDYLSIKYTQMVELRILFAEQILDSDMDGLVSLDEAILAMKPYENAILPRSSLLMETGNDTQWVPIWDPDEDGLMNITSEYVPVLERVYSMLSRQSYPGYNQTKAHISLGATMDMIGELNSSILILQGEGDWQTPLIEAILLEQALLDEDHRDHTLYTYSGLSHFFYPTDGWETAMGPIEHYVLDDLYRWMISPERRLNRLETDIEKNSKKLQSLEEKLDNDIKTVSQSVANSLVEIEAEIEQQEKVGNDYMIPVFIVILVLLIVTLRKRES
jgi:pimeloyl-ACP methyl ester carboxylesterase